MQKKNPQVWVSKQIKRDLKMYVEYMETDFDMSSLEAHQHLHEALLDYLLYLEEQDHIWFFDFILDECTGKGMVLHLRVDYEDGGWCKTRISINDFAGSTSVSSNKYEEAYKHAMAVI